MKIINMLNKDDLMCRRYEVDKQEVRVFQQCNDKLVDAGMKWKGMNSIHLHIGCMWVV